MEKGVESGLWPVLIARSLRVYLSDPENRYFTITLLSLTALIVLLFSVRIPLL